MVENIIKIAERTDEEVLEKEYAGHEHLRQIRYEICSCCSNNLRYKQHAEQLRVCHMCRLPVCPTCICSHTRNKEDGLLEIMERPLCQTCFAFNASIMIRNSDIHVSHPDIHLTDPRCGICSTKRQYSLCNVIGCVCNTFGSLCHEHTHECKQCRKPYCVAHLLKHICLDKAIMAEHVPVFADSKLPSKQAMKRQRKRGRDQLANSEEFLETMKSETYTEAFTLMPPPTVVPTKRTQSKSVKKAKIEEEESAAIGSSRSASRSASRVAPSASKIRLIPRDECCEEVCNQCRDGICKLTVGFHTEEYHGGVQHRCKDFPECEPYASESEMYSSESEDSADSGKTDVRDVAASTSNSEAPIKRRRHISKVKKEVEESPASLTDPF